MAAGALLPVPAATACRGSLLAKEGAALTREKRPPSHICTPCAPTQPSHPACPPSSTPAGGLTGFTIDGPLNSATVLRSDVQSCKSYITVIDSVLLPFNPTTLPPEDWLKPSAAVGVKGCFVQANGMVTGTTLKAGDANSQVGDGWVGWRAGRRDGLAGSQRISSRGGGGVGATSVQECCA